MNWVDLGILITVFIFTFEGIRRGFFVQIIDIIGFLLSLVLSLLFYPLPAKLLIRYFSLPGIAANPIGFLLIWILAEAAFFFLINNLLRKYLFKFSGNHVNKYLGIIPASANALLFASFVLLFLVSMPIQPQIKKNIFDSRIGSVLVEKATILEKPLNSVFGPVTKQGLTFLTIKPEAKESISLQFTQKELTVDLESEQRMVELVNAQRAKLGIAPLKWREDLATVGRKHSTDMFERGYFSHYSPEGKDVGDRLIDAGITYSYAGENLALAPNVERAHTGLMNSQGHKRNILDPAFKEIGIGVINGGVYGEMFTQVFTD